MNTSHRSTMRKSNFRWWLVATVALLTAGVWGYRTYADWSKQRELLAEWQAEERERQLLDKVVSIHFGKPVSLQEWLAEVTRQTGVEVKIENGIRNGWTKFRPISDSIAPDLPVWLDLPPLPAHEAFQTLCSLLHLDGGMKDGGLVLNVELADEPRYLRVNALPPELRTEQLDLFSNTVLEFSHFGDWDYDGDPRWLESSSACFAVVQPERGHRRMEQFLTRLVSACRRSSGIPKVGVAANDPVWEPLWLGGEQEQLLKLQRVLDQPITLQGDGISFQQLVSELRRQTNFSIVASPEALKWLGPLSFDCYLKQVPLRNVLLELIADPLEFEFVPIASCQALAIATKEFGNEFHHQLVLAYPVSDLVSAADLEDSGFALTEVLKDCIDPGNWQDVGGAGDYNLVSRGQVLIVAQRLEVHQRIKELFAAMRTVRSGAARQVVLPPTARQRSNPVVAKRLQELVSLECARAQRRYAIQQLLENGQITLGLEYGRLDHASDFVWCHLPPRPLHENLELLFRSCGYDPELVDYATLPGEQPVVAEPPLAVGVFELRPWLLPRRDQPDLVKLLINAVSSDDWLEFGSRATAVTDQHQLIVCQRPELMEQVAEFVATLSEHMQPGPKKWRGQLLTTEALNQPLEYRSAAAFQRETQLAAENQAIQTKLQQSVSTTLRDQKLGDAILALAREHQLPVVIHQHRPDVDLHRKIAFFAATDQPLGEVLTELLGDFETERWEVRDGYLTLVDPAAIRPAAPPAHSLLYSVDDLIVPRGKLLPQQLVRTLETAIRDNDLEAEVGGEMVGFHYGNLLSKWFFEGESRGPEVFEQLLRDLRSGKLRPVPAEKGDREFLSPPFRPFVTSPIPVVG